MAKLYKTDGTIDEVQPANKTDWKLEELQKIVGGYIEVLTLDKRLIMIINEEGKLSGLESNPSATKIWQDLYETDDYIAGDALVCKSEELK
jgi:hypothetical protein